MHGLAAMLGHPATPGECPHRDRWGKDGLATKTTFYLGFRRGTFINQLRQLRGLTAMPERDPSAASLRARYATEQAASRSRS